MRPAFIFVMGVLLAFWMSAGRVLFGLQGDLLLWYLPTLGLVYVLLHLWIARRVAITGDLGKKVSRGTRVTLILSWATAFVVGFFMPDRIGGELTSIVSHYTGSAVMLEMAIALSNTIGIISITFAGAAVGFAINDAIDRVPEDEPDGPIPMPGHPLA